VAAQILGPPQLRSAPDTVASHSHATMFEPWSLGS